MISLLFICLIAGGAGAILQGMIGIGTGIIIVPLLTFILPNYGVPRDIAIHVALATSMAAIATNSMSALISHYRLGNVKWQFFKKIILFSVSGSYIGALVASYMSASYLQFIFGIFLLSNAFYLLLKKPITCLADAIPCLSLPKLATGGFSIGFIASIVGSGGGILMVPFLHSLKLKMSYSVGTSTLIGFPVAIIGAITYIFIGLSQPQTISTFGYLHWPAFFAITLAGMLCAPLGVRLAAIIDTIFLYRLFIICTILISIKMIISL